MGERLHKVLGQIGLGTLDSGEPSLPFGLLVLFLIGILSDLGLHCLPMSLLWDARLKWVKLCLDSFPLRTSLHLLDEVPPDIKCFNLI